MTVEGWTRRPVVGDRVRVNDSKFPGVYTIQSVGPKNFVLMPEAGGRGLRAPHYMVVDADSDPAPVTPVVYYNAGEIVRVEQGKFAGLYVVIADKGERVNIARLGGDNGRYVRMTRNGLKKMSLDELLFGDLR